MKILCLHGYGTNGDILRNQLQPTMNALGGDHELVFLEGEVPVGKTGMLRVIDDTYEKRADD